MTHGGNSLKIDTVRAGFFPAGASRNWYFLSTVPETSEPSS